MKLAPSPPAGKVAVTEYVGDKQVTYEKGADGQVSSPDQDKLEVGWVKDTQQKAWNLLVPDNLATSVSKDYVPVRKWWVARDFFGSFAGTAAVAAVTTAIAPANMALAGLGIAWVTAANINWIKDRIGQISGIAATSIARVGEKNPRPWMMANDIVQNVGTVVDAATVVLPPLVYYPLLTGMGVVRAVAGAAGGAAGANIGPRQAIKGNLGEVSVKNANQSNLATFAGATAGIAALTGLAAFTGFGTAVMAVAGMGAMASLFTNYKLLQNLDYNPINERGLREVVAHMEENAGEVPGPPSNLMGQVVGLFKRDRLIAGDAVKPLLEDTKFAELRHEFAQLPFLMTVREGKPYLVMKRDHAHDDVPKPSQHPLPEGPDFLPKMAQVQAMFCALQAERILESPEYSSKKSSEGEEAATLWAIREAVKKTPADIRPLLLKMQEKGWSVDTIRFWGEERPAEIRTE
jgi:hypothetical protein